MNAAERARAAALALLALLAATLLGWQRASLAAGSFLPLLWVAPLLLPLPGLIRGRRYTYAWATLLVIGYIALALTEIVADAGRRLLPAAILMFASALFLALVMFLRATRAHP